MMLLGIPPWSAPRREEVIFRMALAGRVRDVIVYNKKARFVSEEAVDLLARLLRPAPHRIGLDEVLRHPYVAGAERTRPPPD